MSHNRAEQRCDSNAAEVPPSLDRHSAATLRHLLETFLRAHASLPQAELVQNANALRPHRLLIDLASARRIGVPVIVFRETPAPTPPALFRKLSTRERQVVRLLVAGFTNDRIARSLGISVATVKDHVHHALRKTSTASRTQLAAALSREGILPP